MLYQLDRAIGYASDGANILRHQFPPVVRGIGYGILLNGVLAKKVTWLHPACLPIVGATFATLLHALQESVEIDPSPTRRYMESIAARTNRVGQQQLEYLANPYHFARKLACKATILSIQLVRRAAIGYLAGSAATYACNYFASDRVKSIIEFGLRTQGVSSIEPVYAAAMGIAFLLFGKFMPSKDEKEQSEHRFENIGKPFFLLLYEELKSSTKEPEPRIKIRSDEDVVELYAKLLTMIASTRAQGFICTTLVMTAIPQATVILPTVTGCAIAAGALLTAQIALEIIKHRGEYHEFVTPK